MSDGGKKIFDQCAFVFLRTRLRASSAPTASQPLGELSRPHLAISSDVRSCEPDVDDEAQDPLHILSYGHFSPSCQDRPNLYSLLDTGHDLLGSESPPAGPFGRSWLAWHRRLLRAGERP